MAVVVEKESVSPPSELGTGKKKDRLVVRMNDKWVDLTGWRNAHPSGSHWIDVFDKADATEVAKSREEPKLCH